MVNERIPRVTGKIFASNAAEGDIGQFGSALTGTKVATDDISIIQALPAYEEGWRGAVVSGRNYPTLQEMNGLQKTLSQQINYLLQNGMAEWDAGTTYFTDQFCRVGSMFYVSLEDNNLGNNPTTTTGFWKIWNPAEGVYANNDLSNLSEAGEAHFANPDLSNLSAPGLDKINQSKALETGSVSSDADVYADIQKYAHSTFDLSKFEVVGSPNITDDGIASGFESSNYIKCGGFSFSKMLSFKGVKFRTGDVSGSTRRDIIDAVCINFNMFVLRVEDGELKLVSSTGDTKSIVSVKNNTNYIVDLDFDLEQGECAVTVIENDTTVTTKTLEFTFTGRTLSYFVIGCRYTGGILNSFDGSIDLKSIAIWADGVPVFSGNKTGLDIIKPDNYEVVGTPTITDDGIASGLSNSNSIKMPNQNWGTENCIEYEFTVTQDMLDNLASSRDPWILWSIDKGYFISQYYSARSGFANYYKLSDGSLVNIMTSIGEPLKLGDSVKVINKVIQGEQLYLKVTVNKQDYLNTKSISDNITWINNDIHIAGYQTYPYYGSINLNSVKFYADNNLIYQPCLKIPYTESKTGSKIVDAAYRDRVQDMYEQFGYAPYYTIDEENQNFTLPMGEIYGMIERKNDELNNPFSLFDYKYADAPIYNMSWLQANGNWYAKSVYISAYEALVVENNSDITAGTTTTLPSGGSYTKRGLSVKVSTDSYTDTDFVINTTDETFRLPLKAALTPVTGGSIPVIGNGMAMGLINGYNSGTFTLQSNTDGAEINVNGAGQTLPYNAGGINRPQNAYVVGLSKDPAISGVIADISGSTGLYLYYYVGETTQSPYIINNSQKLNNDASNLTEPGKTNIKNLVYPDFNNTVSLDKTLNLVQQADKDCYLHVSAESGGDLWVDICDADGVTKLSLIASDTAANVATVQTSPLIPAGTYFKVSLNVGSYHSLTKIYTKGESNV